MRPAALTRLLPLALLAGIGGCADRLDHLGKPPSMTAPGAPLTAVDPLAPARAALARKAPPPPPESYEVASLWRSGPTSLFGDRRARTVGDILTVIIEIDDEASLSNQTRRNRAGSDEASVTAMFGINKLIEEILPKDATLDPAIGLSSTTNSSGAGSVQRTEEITLKLAATVTDMLPNGHLVIFGSQELRVNYELRDLQIAGIIRPEDISRRNEITYDKIADARVVYGGRGQITDMQQPRLGQQIIDIVSPF